MTDNEIVKALECCIANDNKCPDCPIFGSEICGKPALFFKEVFDLINRQKADNERLKKLLEEEEAKYKECAKRFYKEAIKEFAERLKINYSKPLFAIGSYNEFIREVDNLVKEMVGEG